MAGYVIEQTAYHHGEQSLASTIIALAQNYVGSNNINLLVPSGQFGTRAEAGKNAASARYINTFLSPMAREIFNVHDDAILTHLNDDGQKIEPQWYLPIIPMALVNGCSGIGTGWATDVPPFNPRDIVSNLLLLLLGQDMKEMKPWFKGFTGSIERKTEGDGYQVRGKITKIADHTFVISEIPVGKATSDYLEVLEKLKEDNNILSYDDECTEDVIKIIVRMNEAQALAAEKFKGGLLGRFKLEGSIPCSNMVMFDANGQIKKYSSIPDLLRDFYHFRLVKYEKRKQSMILAINDELLQLDNRARFILMVVNNQFAINKITASNHSPSH